MGDSQSAQRAALLFVLQRKTQHFPPDRANKVTQWAKGASLGELKGLLQKFSSNENRGCGI